MTDDPLEELRVLKTRLNYLESLVATQPTEGEQPVSPPKTLAESVDAFYALPHRPEHAEEAELARLEKLAGTFVADPALDREMATADRVGHDVYAAAGRYDFGSGFALAQYRDAKAAHARLTALRKDGTR